MDDLTIKNFLHELNVLAQKHGITIGGCGCCGSPHFAGQDYLQYNSEMGVYEAKGWFWVPDDALSGDYYTLSELKTLTKSEVMDIIRRRLAASDEDFNIASKFDEVVWYVCDRDVWDIIEHMKEHMQ